MKKILLLLIPMLFLTGCKYKIISQQELNSLLETERTKAQLTIDLKQKEFIFDKNNDCINIKSKLDVAGTNALGNEVTIDSTFYSPITNSCLYTTLTYGKSGKDTLKRRELFDSTFTWNTQTPIIVCNEAVTTTEDETSQYWINEFPCDKFTEKIAEYKEFK